MLVYSNRQSELSAAAIASELRRRLRLASSEELAEQRIMLVMAGQLEQAALDSGARWASYAEEITRRLASSFVAASLSQTHPELRSCEHLEDALEMVERLLPERSSSMTVNVPEGFAWYAVYPDAYLAAVLTWCSNRARSDKVIVIGLRSIGTTLAAVVAEGLRTRGFEPACLTVRPTGDPFAREVELPFDDARPDAALVVDEGPGLSGASMFAVAAALSRKGIAETAIHFFPAHLNGPGRMASDEARRCWSKVEKFALATEAIPIGGRSLRAHLRGRSASLIDVGGGRWLDRAGVPAQAVRTLAPILEAPKYMAQRRGGGATLWKFTGFTLVPERKNGKYLTTSEAAEARLERLGGLVPKSLGSVHGWLGSEWIEGRNLSHEDATSNTIRQVLAYLKRAADGPLHPAREVAARERLAEILTHNSVELLGGLYRTEISLACDLLRTETRLGELPAYGDGRMAPHEWIETARGTLVKTDAQGHAFDHTIVGPQSVLWDVAGMMVEWQLPRHAGTEVLASLGLPAPFVKVLSCYRAAYAAFRGGVAWLCGSEINRAGAIEYYREHLIGELDPMRDGRT